MKGLNSDKNFDVQRINMHPKKIFNTTHNQLRLLTAFLLVIGLLMAFYLMMDIPQVFFPLSSTHPFWENVFFINYTFIGDGVFAICLVLILFFYFKKKNESLLLMSGFIISFIVIQLVKNLLSNGALDLYIEPGQYLFFTKEENLVNAHAFPSGHTAFAFVIATTWMMHLKNAWKKMLVILGAFLLGFSRMYLAGNSLWDIISGMTIGVSVVTVLHVFYLRIKAKPVEAYRRHRKVVNNDAYQNGNMLPV